MNELRINEGMDDLIEGNESYSMRYVQGLMFSNGACNLKDINGSEGLIASIMEKIKQFCAWFAGLFSSKGNTGKATKEKGIKTIPIIKPEETKITSVVASELKPEAVAPKVHEPTAEQKKSGKLKIKSIKRIAEPDKQEPEKEVEMVLVPHRLDDLYRRLRKCNIEFGTRIEAITSSYVPTVKLIDGFEEIKHWDGIKVISTDAMTTALEPINKAVEKFNTAPNFDNITIENLKDLANNQITHICKLVEEAIVKTRTFPKVNMENGATKEALNSVFQSKISSISEDKQTECAKILMRLLRSDYNCWCLLDISDWLANIKKDICDGVYFIRAPKN